MEGPTLSKGSRLWKSKADFFRPFRSTTASTDNGIAQANVRPPDASSWEEEVGEPDLKELNTSLQTLVDMFPDVEPEVFRELLLRVSPESRLHLVSDQLLNGNRRKEAIRSRFRAPPKQNTPVPGRLDTSLQLEDTFRGDRYCNAVRDVFRQEFKSLSRSTIQAVMAEQNYSYSKARPVLQQLSTKGWRFSLAQLWNRKPTTLTDEDHPYVIWPSVDVISHQCIPYIRHTGSLQLDRELYDLFISATAAHQQEALLQADVALAMSINAADAQSANALYDCSCCYDSVPFEQLAVCDEHCHQLCLDCIRRVVTEAVYGQGWTKTADLEKGTVRCFSPVLTDCSGRIAVSVVQRAVFGASGAAEMWHEFQTRLANEALMKSQLPLQRCPFCPYAEIAEIPPFSIKDFRTFSHHLATRTTSTMQLVFLLFATISLFFAIAVLCFAAFIWISYHTFSTPRTCVTASWGRVYRARQSLKFKCRNSSCLRVSCTHCAAYWKDPHICFEKETTSLRTALESSATAAIKRTCPRCLLSFVKSAGCNKLVCNCGYIMCYICRQEISSKEGYGHFCQHFRPHGGRCVECDKCDLYGDEDEDATIQAAIEATEKAWQEQETGSNSASAANEHLLQKISGRRAHSAWYESILDDVIDLIAA